MSSDKQANREYRTKLESYYTGSDAHLMWQGLKNITDYKWKASRELPSDASLQMEVNAFYARLEASNTSMYEITSSSGRLCDHGLRS